MKNRYYQSALCAILIFVSLISCRKESESVAAVTSPTVRYEITTSNSLSFMANNQVLAYTNSYFNAETITDLPSGGIKWSKEFVIREAKKGDLLEILGILQFKGTIGDVTTRIYINNVKKSETVQGIPANSDGYPSIVINAHYIF